MDEAINECCERDGQAARALVMEREDRQARSAPGRQRRDGRDRRSTRTREVRNGPRPAGAATVGCPLYGQDARRRRHHGGQHAGRHGTLSARGGEGTRGARNRRQSKARP